VNIKSQTIETWNIVLLSSFYVDLSRVRSMGSFFYNYINVDKGIMTGHIKISVFEDVVGHKIIR
jgi:fructose-1,6-bisphosphatase/inositol monophosphatase family enzyme